MISGSAEGKLGKTTCLTIKLLLVRVGIDSSSSSRGVNTDASTSVSSSTKVFTISVTPNSFLLPESHGSVLSIDLSSKSVERSKIPIAYSSQIFPRALLSR